MARKAARLTFPQIQLEFHTEHSQYKITNDTSNKKGVDVASSDVLSNSLVTFQTNNTLGDNIGSFSIVVSGQSVRWDRVLNVNDIVIIRVDPNEVESSQPVYNTNIFTGLVSEVSELGQYGNDSLMFQISGQSFAKAFTQYKIGLVSQVEQQISSMGWLWDMNAELEPITHGSGSGTGGGGYIPIGSYSKSVSSKAKAVAKAIGGKLGIKPALIYGQMGMETGMKETLLVKYNNLSGITFVHQKGARQGSHQPDGSMYYAYFKNLGYYAGAYSTILEKDFGGRKPKSADQMATWLHDAHYFTSDPYSYAQGIKTWAAQYSGKGSGGGGGGSSSGSDDSGDGGDTKGEVNSTAAEIKREQQNSVGVPFFGNTVATIENNLIKRFKPYMVYSYDNGKNTLWDYLDWSGMQSWTDYEYLLDSSQFSNANGSLWDLQQNALRIPFNELFFDSLANGKSKLVVRRTPFNPEDWNNLTKVTIDSTDIIDHEITKTDLQQYSVFVVNPATPTILGIHDGTLLSAYPQTNQALINYYGYAKYEVDDLYLSGRTNDNNKKRKKAKKNTKGKGKGKGKGKEKGKSKDKSKSKDKGKDKSKDSKKKPEQETENTLATTSKDNSTGKMFKFKDVKKFLDSISSTTLRLNKNKYAKALADAANNISAAQAFDMINSYCANGYEITQETYDNVLGTASGGGLPNTGTKEASYKNIVECIKKANGDQNAFMSIAKSTIKNVSDEFLRQVWQSRDDKGSISKENYKLVYDTSRNAGNTTGEANASDLKFFTRILYNWYADNFNFYSGNIVVSGNPDIRVGCILDEIDFYNKQEYDYPGMRFYIESVAHRFSYTEGYTTSIGVTRGMKMPVGNQDDPRFNNLWGTSMDYLGGYMGEATTANLALATSNGDEGSDSTSDGSSFGGPKGNAIAVKAAEFGYQFRKDGNPKINGRKMKEVYAWGGGHSDKKNPLTHDLHQGTIALDCSGFTYWCFKHFGVTIGTITHTQLADPKFERVNVGQSSKKMKVGDLVFMENCEHVMFYIGNNKLMGWNGKGSWNESGGCQIQTLDTVIGWTHGIDGVVARFK